MLKMKTLTLSVLALSLPLQAFSNAKTDLQSKIEKLKNRPILVSDLIPTHVKKISLLKLERYAEGHKFHDISVVLLDEKNREIKTINEFSPKKKLSN
jgi:hypothetical protein